MALTKLPKNAIGTGAIDASKIEDGTLQAVEISGTISSDKIATGTIANNKLINSTFTIRGTSRALGDSFSLGVNVDWQSVIVADGSTGTTGSAGKGYFINTTSAAHTFTLPASATRGDTIALKDYAGTFASNKLTINRNGHNIQGVANNSLIGTNRASLVLVYVDSTKGWLYAEEHNVADLGQVLFTSATGGTITTSGDFKTHIFTGDGCFVVSTLGNVPTNPLGGPNTADLLVVAGGGGSTSGHYGGGGAGGLRNLNIPISSPGSYPIAIGGGGTGSSPGVNSSALSYIATGGGSLISGVAGSGGSGAGGCYCGSPAGTGNTPPVSPSQGNSGGTGAYIQCSVYAAGGGGGASATGGNGTAPPGNQLGGAGGAGLNVTPTFGPGLPNSGVYAGGGGGATAKFLFTPTGTPGTGGTGGGGNGGTFPTPGTNGTSNTGGGGGGRGTSGGSGIVVIRYKFQ